MLCQGPKAGTAYRRWRRGKCFHFQAKVPSLTEFWSDNGLRGQDPLIFCVPVPQDIAVQLANEFAAAVATKDQIL